MSEVLDTCHGSLRTNDRSKAVLRDVGESGEDGRLSVVFFDCAVKLAAADKFHLLIGGSYAGLGVGVAALRRGIFELCV